MFSVFASALADISEGLRLRRVWVALANEGIGDQHRRTTLGPLWLLINYLAFAGTFIFIFNHGNTGPGYVAYVATGLLVWFFIMEVVTTSVTLFVREESFIKGTTLPLSVYVFRDTLQAVIRDGYALAGCIALLLIGGVAIGTGWLWSAVGLLVILLAAPAFTTVFAFLGVFFPDSQFIVSNLMRVGMFITPVFWAPSGRGGIQEAAYVYNPFTYFLEIVRGPIMTGQPSLHALGFCVLLTIGLWVAAFLLLGKFRRQVALVI
ncbi:MAG TPA: ABC transporter permease [Devosia sp.]|nr:ABC transporter permease [Devosia sp.]